jgi:hypothetical protein
MKLEKLSIIYRQIKLNNETYGLFNFNTNSIAFHVFFDIGKVPFKLGFLPIGKPEQIWFDVIRSLLLIQSYQKMTTEN